MYKPFKILTAAALVVLLSSCAGFREMEDMAKPVNTSALKIGMTRQETEQVLHKKPYGVVAARNYTETHTQIEVVQYTEGDISSPKDNYWLYFINGQLDHWQRADPRRTPII